MVFLVFSLSLLVILVLLALIVFLIKLDVLIGLNVITVTVAIGLALLGSCAASAAVRANHAARAVYASSVFQMEGFQPLVSLLDSLPATSDSEEYQQRLRQLQDTVVGISCRLPEVGTSSRWRLGQPMNIRCTYYSIAGADTLLQSTRQQVIAGDLHKSELDSDSNRLIRSTRLVHFAAGNNGFIALDRRRRYGDFDLLSKDYMAFMVIPVQAKQAPAGVLVVESDKAQAFSHSYVRSVHLLTRILATANLATFSPISAGEPVEAVPTSKDSSSDVTDPSPAGDADNVFPLLDQQDRDFIAGNLNSSDFLAHAEETAREEALAAQKAWNAGRLLTFASMIGALFGGRRKVGGVQS